MAPEHSQQRLSDSSSEVGAGLTKAHFSVQAWPVVHQGALSDNFFTLVSQALTL
jgi:hypothetical protein